LRAGKTPHRASAADLVLGADFGGERNGRAPSRLCNTVLRRSEVSRLDLPIDPAGFLGDGRSIRIISQRRGNRIDATSTATWLDVLVAIAIADVEALDRRA
jgi:hypothetical protein